jgi:Ca2+-binding EF-hand superfamily protein
LEHFVFNCSFFHVDHNFEEVKTLFDIIDSKNDGYIDEQEFE